MPTYNVRGWVYDWTSVTDSRSACNRRISTPRYILLYVLFMPKLVSYRPRHYGRIPLRHQIRLKGEDLVEEAEIFEARELM